MDSRCEIHTPVMTLKMVYYCTSALVDAHLMSPLLRISRAPHYQLNLTIWLILSTLRIIQAYYKYAY
jgi:hypothetical protein